jgi:hypothetical protein
MLNPKVRFHLNRTNLASQRALDVRARVLFHGCRSRLKREMWMKKARKGTLRTGGVGL